MKTAEMCCSKTCVKFGHCFGNQGWAEAVQKYFFVLKMSSFKISKSFKSVVQGDLEIFEEVHLGGGGGGRDKKNLAP